MSRLQFENNNEIGVFSMLSSSYALVALGASEKLLQVGFRFLVWRHIVPSGQGLPSSTPNLI